MRESNTYAYWLSFCARISRPPSPSMSKTFGGLPSKVWNGIWGSAEEVVMVRTRVVSSAPAVGIAATSRGTSSPATITVRGRFRFMIPPWFAH
ncbi:MAG: hypothetical protein HYT80_04060 [Euryarchaeota archaeon]|nr:hypothetical protein [Euryarchaeota archaeon]